MTSTNEVLAAHYRCPTYLQGIARPSKLPKESGYFRFGREAICYGSLASGGIAETVTDELHDVLESCGTNGAGSQLPFDAGQVIENLRRERYAPGFHGDGQILTEALRRAYYFVRPLLPVPIRKGLQKMRLNGWDKIRFPAWPVDWTIERIYQKLLILSLKAQGLKEIPFIWFWPNGYPSCAIITHDVETSAGRDFSSSLMDIDDSFGMRSAFQIVPERRYWVPQRFRDSIRERGFEINIHDLNHDGHLFAERAEFLKRAKRINEYAKNYGARGFRSAALYRNTDWYDALEFSYDMSVPNVGHLDPQRGGCCTVMPYFIGRILELPLTTTQDYSLFHILREYSIGLWKRQVGLIMEQHGLMSFVTHPDYLIPKRASATYVALLEYLAQLRSEKKIWLALPGEVDTWWRQRSRMRLEYSKDNWRIEGEGSQRAKLAYARLDGEALVYDVPTTKNPPEEGRSELAHGFREQ